MKKSLIALAVVGAFTAQAAMADVTVYGQANLSFDMVNNGALANSASGNNVASNTSRLGFKGSEDLGDGLSAIFQMEQQINMDSTTNAANAAPTGATNTFATRDTFAGLSSSSMGTLIAGIHDTPYKMATRGYDLFADGVADNRSIMGVKGAHDARLGNVVAFITPSMSGFTMAVAMVAGAEFPVANATKGSASSLAVMYADGPWKAAFAYQNISYGTAGTGTLAGVVSDKDSAYKLGGSYDFGQGVVNAVYEKASHKSAALANVDTLNQGNFYLSGKYNISASDAIKAGYTIGGKTNNGTAAQVANTGAKQFTIGYDHSLSKRTSVYALYSKLSNDTLATNAFNQGSSAAAANGGGGSSPSVFSLGMKHAF